MSNVYQPNSYSPDDHEGFTVQQLPDKEPPPVGQTEWAAALPVASGGKRGCYVLVAGAQGVADGLYVCLKHADDTYGWVQVAAG